MKCQHCGADMAQGELFCGNCGQKMQSVGSGNSPNEHPVFCGECGAKASIGAKFCLNCGNPLDGSSKAVVSGAAPKAKKSKAPIIAIVCLTAAIISAAAVFIFMVTLSDKRIGSSPAETEAASSNEIDGASSAVDELEQQSDSIPVLEAEQHDTEPLYEEPLQEIPSHEEPAAGISYSAPVFTSAEASSMLGMSATGNEYYPSYVLDDNPSTCWASDYREGLHPSITLRTDSSQRVSGIRFANGYFKSAKTYYNNRLITKVLISYEGGSLEYSCDADQYLVLQDVPFDAPVETNFITIKILDSADGVEGWNDICISTVEVY